MIASWQLPFGANPDGSATRFRVWAPSSTKVDVVLYGPNAEALHPLEPRGDGWFEGRAAGCGDGVRYRYRLDESNAYPDPASRSQPDGVHAPSEVVDPRAYEWHDAGWRGRPLDELVIYELHVGTATRSGTFEALVPHLEQLCDLGVTAIELMPVAEFAGRRNWGYDGVYLFAPSRAYGGATGLKRLIDAAHAHDLAVLLDVVYNHLGPEGNYLPAVTGGRFFTERHRTPWGDAVNYDQPGSDAVRGFVIANALHWVHEYHVDGLRLDATHAIVDESPRHLLAELAERVHAAVSRPITLIAEDERNDARLVRAPPHGYGLDAVWADDFHHELRSLVAGDAEGYYSAFRGATADLARTLERGWFYEGQTSPHTGEARGTPADDVPPERLVYCIQNHDQVGNRAHGERLHHDVDLAVYRAACALLLLAPYTPLLWMGQEWAASSPFLYFTDHPEQLGRLVTEGRREEFSAFSAFADAARRERIPDPQDEETFLRSKLDWRERDEPPHAGVLALHRELLRLRRTEPALRERRRGSFAAEAPSDRVLTLRRTAAGAADVLLVAGFGGEHRVPLPAVRGGRWRLLLATEEPRFGGAGDWGALEGDALTLRGAGAVVLAGG